MAFIISMLKSGNLIALCHGRLLLDFKTALPNLSKNEWKTKKEENLKLCVRAGHGGYMPVISALGRQRQADF